MGRHSAGNGASVDPIVAAALRQRPTSVQPGPPRHAPGLVESQQAPSQHDQGGALGWPGEPRKGSGLGWPDGAGATDTAGTPAADTAAAEPIAAVTPVAPAAGDERPPRRWSGWRRWFGGSPAATPAPSGSTAA